VNGRMKLAHHAMRERGWFRTFDDPVELPGGGGLHALRDSGHYIAKLAKRDRDHGSPARLAAIEALMLVVEHGSDAMLLFA